ncbi:MAG: phosphonoacetaldehyde hydrolase [Sarcina sp.]
MIKAVIFDWAGTTIDYGCFSPVGAFMDAFAKMGIEITIDEARKPMGKLKIDHARAILEMPRVRDEFKKIYMRDFNENDVNDLYEIFEKKLFDTLKDYVKLKPNVLYVMDTLKNKGIRIGTTTGYTKEMLDIILPIAYEEGYRPEFNIASDQVAKGRPHPCMIEENAKAFGIKDMKSIIKVGDTLVDIEEGKNAGVYTVAVVLGSSELGLTQEEVNNMDKAILKKKMNVVKRKFLEAGADYIIDDISELVGIIGNF